MRAPDDVKEALAAIGYEVKDIAPTDDAASTMFSRINEKGNKEFFIVCYAVEGKAISMADLLNNLQQ